MRELLTGLSRPVKRGLLLAFDISIMLLSLWLAIVIRQGSKGLIDDINSNFLIFILVPLSTVPHCIHRGLYRSIVRYSGAEVIGSVARATLYGLATFVAVYFLLPDKPPVPRSVPIIYWALATAIMAGARFVIGSWLLGNSIQNIFFRVAGFERPQSSRGLPVAIYGAGSAGRQLEAALQNGSKFRPVAFIDDDESLQTSTISKLKVYASTDIKKLLKQTGAEEILLAIPSASPSTKKQIIARLEPFDIHVRTVPGMEEIALEGVQIQQLREVAVADILGREVIPPEPKLLEKCISGKSVMVTGAGGSIGSELCRQILLLKPKRLVLFENSEYNLYKIHGELEDISHHIESPSEIIPVLGSVTQPWRLLEIIRKFEIQSLYHAAAYKHVPIVEYNSHHGFRNNVIGTLYTAQAAVLAGVENFVLISTDKAVRPTNMMGATKRIAELILQAMSEKQHLNLAYPELFKASPDQQIENNTRFTMVRFGNVLDSSGSVVPRFRQQIKDGGPVTVTHPEIIRYFMTIPEAAQLVIQAGSMGQGGDVFVLDMGEPVKIAQLAKQLIHLSGLTIKDDDNPYGDIEIEYTGLRPGEKLYEELLIGEEVYTTEHQKIMRANEAVIPWEELLHLIESISAAFKNNQHIEIRSHLTAATEVGYKPTAEVRDWLR